MASASEIYHTRVPQPALRYLSNHRPTRRANVQPVTQYNTHLYSILIYFIRKPVEKRTHRNQAFPIRPVENRVRLGFYGGQVVVEGRHRTVEYVLSHCESQLLGIVGSKESGYSRTVVTEAVCVWTCERLSDQVTRSVHLITSR